MSNISGTTKLVAVWGHPVSHSQSPENAEAAVAAVRALGLVGVNVTVPLKELVLPYLDRIDDVAARIGSVNTVHNDNGKLVGYSTDSAGFLQSLQSAGQAVSGRDVYLLGAGGSARAVAWALASAGSRCRIANRTPARSVLLAADINSVHPGMALAAEWGMETEPFDLLVNTTSLGMQPRPEEMPLLPPGAFSGKPFVCDLIYAPAQTRLLADAKSAGCGTLNGLKMLVCQGAISLSIWTGRPLSEMPVAVMEQAVQGSLHHS